MRIVVAYYVAVAALIAVAIGVGGCAGLRPYEGPRGGSPRLEVSSRFQLDSVTEPKQPTWVERFTGHLVNPTDRVVTVWIDCPTFVQTITVPPQKVQDFLVERGDDGARPVCVFEER